MEREIEDILLTSTSPLIWHTFWSNALVRLSSKSFENVFFSWCASLNQLCIILFDPFYFFQIFSG